MGLFDYLTLGATPAERPNFNEGVERGFTDLQVRALLYFFKRLRINRLATFSLGENLKYTDGQLWDDIKKNNDADIDRLDKQYNLHEFHHLLLNEEHRVLIDWPKNKFRSFCILSEYPTSSDLRVLVSEKEIPLTNPQGQKLPVFEDYKKRPVYTFAFSVLPVKTVLFTRDLALDLAQSLLYQEHHSYVLLPSRIHIAEKAIFRFCDSNAIKIELTESLKIAIVHEYLKRLAFHVQLVRIYLQCVKLREGESPVGSPKKAAVSDSPRTLKPTKSFLQLPNISQIPVRPSLSPRKSTANLVSYGSGKSLGELSPVKLDSSPRKQLSSRPSIANFRANEIYNPVTSPPISPQLCETKSANHASLLNHLSELGKENTELWGKCKASIREKLAKEKEILRKQRG